jgi:hypothetical protein
MRNVLTNGTFSDLLVCAQVEHLKNFTFSDLLVCAQAEHLKNGTFSDLLVCTQAERLKNAISYNFGIASVRSCETLINK